jgi:uncharacterized protein YjbI with pentapeptide repeats
MGICEDAPDEYCGHVLEPEDAEVDREADDDWHVDTQNAVCLRDPKYDGLCVWHADTDEKTAEELVEARLTPGDVSWQGDYIKENLNGSILRGISFQEGFSFAGCVLAYAECSYADFPRVNFFNACLNQTSFFDAKLLEAEFSNADLLGTEFPHAYLRGAEFSDAYLEEATFSHAYGPRAEFSHADLLRADFFDAKFPNSTFSHVDLEMSEFSHANFREAEFSDAYLKRADFSYAYLKGADFRRTNLSKVNLSEANAREAVFSEADLRGIVFKPACVSEVEIGESDTDDSLGASLEDTQIEDRTDLRGADLSGVRLYQTAFRDVRINDETTFGIDDDGKPGKACRYEYDPNTGVSIDDNTSRLEAAAWTYRRLESLFEENAMDERARNAHIRKQEAQRQNLRENEFPPDPWLRPLGQYLVSTLNWHLHRHGESLRRLLGVSGLLIFLCGIVYSVAGIARQDSEMYLTVADLADPRAVLVDLLNGWYFSVITFSTIGYGDFRPASPLSRLLVGIESLAGALFIALFVFVIGRRVAR